MRYSLLAFLLLMPAAAIGAPAPQSVLVRLPADDTAKAGWRQKENCTLAVAAEGAGTLDWNTRYGAFNFGWATWYPPKPLDMRDAYRIRFRVKGDGSGGILHLQLGVIDPGKPAVYYGNRADQVALTFTDWREAAFLLPRFGTGAARDREADLARINFVEFFVDRKGETQSCRILLQEMRVEAGTAAEQTAMAGYRQEAARASLPLRKDGSNLLPNAGFELDLSGAGAPDFWHGSDWSTGSRYSVERKSVHSGQTSIRLECANAGQRASYDMAIPLEPGPYVFEGWYHTRGVKAQKQHGVDARLIVQDAEDRQLFLTHAYGDPSKGGWRRLEARFTAPPGSARLSLCLFNYYAAGSVWWDDLSLRWDAEAAARMEAARVRDAAALKEAKAMVEEVSRSVEALAEGTTEEKVKKAALRWAVEDARLAMDAGQGVP